MEYLVVARKHQDTWYVGSINNSKHRNINIAFDFLDKGEYTAEIYSDSSDTDRFPNHLVHQTIDVRKSDKLDLDLASGGGFVICIRKK